MILEDVLEQASNARAGFELASFKEAGLPVYLLTVRVLTQERKPLSPIDEGTLKAIAAGLDTPGDIGEFLGLAGNVLTPVLAGLYTLELINYVRAMTATAPKVSLTKKGANVLADAAIISPKERTVRICFDALTKRLLFVAPAALDRPRDMKERGILEIPTGASKRPEVEDIPLEDFDHALARQSGGRERVGDLLAVRRIERRELNYLPCLMLFYRNIAQPTEIDVAFWREDGPSLEHETIFRRLGGHDLVGAQFLSNGRMEPLIEIVEHGTDHQPPLSIEAATTESATQTSPRQEDIPSQMPHASVDTIESIYCHQHPALLKKALLTSKKRLLIISPWIRHQVVNWEFIASLEALLRQGVDVHIGYGLDDGDAGAKGDAAKSKLPITPQAERDLKQLEEKYKSKFKFTFVGNTHRKVLISDDNFAVVTSFNWLSFKGDPRDKPRDEGGIVIRKKTYVDNEFERAVNLLKNGYSGASAAASSAGKRS
ncbi:phospholipase D-like domain-containing protein [Pseudoduganella aquatica]|uniref:phospholipase D-like domain-containing protein n=1 Tax=Pseudoduganella aquatica TaxID=2660641 RepID=UPI001E4D1CF0|nr:phospholipase D-like domain-containing protein [Pseudoduganella aquatica]